MLISGRTLAEKDYWRLTPKQVPNLSQLGSNTSDDGLIRVSNRYGSLGAVLIAGKRTGLRWDSGYAQERLTCGTDSDGRRQWACSARYLRHGITTWSSASRSGQHGLRRPLRVIWTMMAILMGMISLSSLKTSARKSDRCLPF